MMNRTQFSELPISDEIKKAVAEMGFEEATFIQSQSIPLILEGHDIIGQSQTGTGKTAAFGIPIIEMISKELKGKTQALVLCPTRELAIQGCEEIRKFAKYKHNLKVIPIYGGQNIDRQINSLKTGAEIVIGTPGRIMDHLRRHTLKLKNLSMMVLDEADEMLNMGFREDIETILRDVPENRQTILFSATMPPEIMQITHQYQKNPQMVKMVLHELTVPGIKQYFHEVPSGKKIEALSRLLDYYSPKRSLVFCNTKRMVDELVSEMQFRGYSPDGLHGDMKQQARTTVMNSFKSGKIDILIATDVAARGIDVEDIDAVFNFDLPQDEEYYIHRIGRTGRAGKTGASYTLVSGRKQINALKEIERQIKTKIEHKAIPFFDEINVVKNEKLIESLTEVLKSGAFRKFEFLIDKLMENDFTSAEIASAALHLLSENANEGTDEDIQFDALIKRQTEEHKKAQKTPAKSKAPRKTKVMDFKSNMVRYVLDIGRDDKVTANHIVGAIAGESGLPGSAIGSIIINDSHSIVEIPQESSDLVLQAMKGCKIKGKFISMKLKRSKKKAKAD